MPACFKSFFQIAGVFALMPKSKKQAIIHSFLAREEKERIAAFQTRYRLKLLKKARVRLSDGGMLKANKTLIKFIFIPAAS